MTAVGIDVPGDAGRASRADGRKLALAWVVVVLTATIGGLGLAGVRARVEPGTVEPLVVFGGMVGLAAGFVLVCATAAWLRTDAPDDGGPAT